MALHSGRPVKAGTTGADASTAAPTDRFVVLALAIAKAEVVHRALGGGLHPQRRKQSVGCRLGDFHIAGNHRRRRIGMQQGAGRHNQLDRLETAGIEGDLFAHQAAKHVEHHSLSYG